MAQFEYLTIELIVPWVPSICTIRSEEKSARLKANSAPHSGERAQSMAEGRAYHRAPHASSVFEHPEGQASAVDVKRDVPYSWYTGSKAILGSRGFRVASTGSVSLLSLYPGRYSGLRSRYPVLMFHTWRS